MSSPRHPTRKPGGRRAVPGPARVVLQRQPLPLDAAEAEFVRTTFTTPPLGEHRAKRCSGCLGRVSFDHSHDTFFCEACDLWLEARCGDQRCRLCRRRPARPSHRRQRAR